MGSHVSKVRSLRMDRLTKGTVQLIKALGNDRSSEIWGGVYVRMKSDDLSLGPIGVERLCVAAEEGDCVGIMRCIAQGCDINAQSCESADRDGDSHTHPIHKTPLHLAVFGGHALAVELLILNGAEVPQGIEQMYSHVVSQDIIKILQWYRKP